MKIISWNINGYRAITGQNKKVRYDKVTNDNVLFDFIGNENPDILCLQETKAEPEQIDSDKIRPIGYESYYSSCKIKKGYSGVAIFSKIKPDYIKYGIGIEKFDAEGRIIEIGIENISVFSIYFPNGQQGQERINYKLDFYDALFDYINQIRKSGRNIVISGDYNTAHKEIDLARPKENIKISGFLPEERVKIDEIIKMGYVDSFREFNNQGNNYTWWSARGNAKKNNVGWRIDYHFCDEKLMADVKKSYHLANEEGSDHCPIVLEL